MYMHGLEQDVLKTVQTALNARGFGPLVVDGINGPKTIAAVKAFQSKAGLAVDGIVGPKTVAALSKPIVTDNTPLPGLSAPMASGVSYGSAGPAALPTGTPQPLPSAPAGTVYSPPPQIVEIAAPAQAQAKNDMMLPLLLAGAAAAALIAMG